MSISKILFIIGSIILLSVFWRPSDQFAFRVFFGLCIWGLAWFFHPRYDTSFDRGSLLPPLDGRSDSSVKAKTRFKPSKVSASSSAPTRQAVVKVGKKRATASSSVNDPYAQLLVACVGDRATVDRLIAYEMSKDKRLSKNAATLEALDRLYIDRRHRL